MHRNYVSHNKNNSSPIIITQLKNSNEYKNTLHLQPLENCKSVMESNQYSLKQNFFDPAKSSPPNIFMIKLYARMINYESKHKNDVIFDNK